MNTLMPHVLGSTDAEAIPTGGSSWLDDFHRGSRHVLQQCYVDHFDAAERAIGSILSGADKETVIHELFYRLVADRDFREKFREGSLRAWIGAVARNLAIDYLRRRRRERPVDGVTQDFHPRTTIEASIEARQMVTRFRDTHLPERYHRVFDARFVQELDQSEAARTLGMHRTTLLYQEHRIRKLLKSFVLRSGLR